MQRLIILEMNEVNYDYIESYIAKGKLKNFSRFFEKHGYCRTTSDTRYEILEPWIQWVSARTGKSYGEHQVFRLGDIISSQVEQHWEQLESQGFSVAAVSPINAANRTRNSPFWIPDPWVDTQSSGSQFVKDLSEAIRQAVNDNAAGALTRRSISTLIRALITKSKLGSWPSYMAGIWGSVKRQHWSKAIVLDRLLADVFFRLWAKHTPDFATLFLNSAAHIQHHYMFNSGAYEGDQENPAWYVGEDADPVLEIYELYDSILGEALKLGARVIVGTGLRQIPYEKVTFYYRLKHHQEFLLALSVPFCRVSPRMSRDFLLECRSVDEAIRASVILSGLTSIEGHHLFDVDNRGDSLFVTLVYPYEIHPNFKVIDESGREVLNDLHHDVAFVAIKNGHHDAIGYYMDTAYAKGELSSFLPLEEMHAKVMTHFCVS